MPKSSSASQPHQPIVLQNLNDIYLDGDCNRLLTTRHVPDQDAILREVNDTLGRVHWMRFQRAAFLSQKVYPNIDANSQAMARELVLDPNLEMMIPYTSLVEELTQALADRPQLSIEQMKDLIKAFLLKVRKLYYKKLREAPKIPQKEID